MVTVRFTSLVILAGICDELGWLVWRAAPLVPPPLRQVVVLGFLALMGSNLIRKPGDSIGKAYVGPKDILDRANPIAEP